MDDIDLCPPWWPSIIWWLIHHPHGPGPDPGPLMKTKEFQQLDAHFAKLAITALAGRLGDKSAVESVTTAAERLQSNPMPGLARLTGMR